MAVYPYRIFVPSKHRSRTISTHRYFPPGACTIVVHTEQERADYAQTVDPASIVVSYTKPDAYGLTRQREWICRNLAEPGEWFIFADDNITGMEAVPASLYSLPQMPQVDPLARRTYAQPCTPGRFILLVDEMIALAQKHGAHLCGFAVNGNPFYKYRKYRTAAYVVGKLMLWHNVPYTWDHTITMEDDRNTAEHLLRYGAVLVNNYVRPLAKHFQPGGMGTYAERLPYLRQDVPRLLSAYPGLFRSLGPRTGFEANTAVSLRLHTPDQIARWRAQLIAERNLPYE